MSELRMVCLESLFTKAEVGRLDTLPDGCNNWRGSQDISQGEAVDVSPDVRDALRSLFPTKQIKYYDMDIGDAFLDEDVVRVFKLVVDGETFFAKCLLKPEVWRQERSVWSKLYNRDVEDGKGFTQIRFEKLQGAFPRCYGLCRGERSVAGIVVADYVESPVLQGSVPAVVKLCASLGPKLEILAREGWSLLDIHPDNIRMTSTGRFCFTDIGNMFDHGGTDKSNLGIHADYCSPVLNATGRPDLETDLYSFGMTLGVLLAGSELLGLVQQGKTLREAFASLAGKVRKRFISTNLFEPLALELENVWTTIIAPLVGHGQESRLPETVDMKALLEKYYLNRIDFLSGVPGDHSHHGTDLREDFDVLGDLVDGERLVEAFEKTRNQASKERVESLVASLSTAHDALVDKAKGVGVVLDVLEKAKDGLDIRLATLQEIWDYTLLCCHALCWRDPDVLARLQVLGLKDVRLLRWQEETVFALRSDPQSPLTVVSYPLHNYPAAVHSRF